MAASEERERTLPKFGEWDVNDPATSEGFTVIFAKASDEKKAAKMTGSIPSKKRSQNSNSTKQPEKKKWLVDSSSVASSIVTDITFCCCGMVSFRERHMATTSISVAFAFDFPDIS
ncbi:hypothetical protein Godav_020438 [Gossypium davidsonii]|uniref:RIN4 pathogenic type III effector avirulence factor Avr cleavage site domain-containing protein n=1 Tax=Gossypium davidsonii TaxID=34287 RepID=A0A7J8R491_GOSDV|nr:hypothetical protein [Gossypium davidsonii]